jgi:hypothetical protein
MQCFICWSLQLKSFISKYEWVWKPFYLVSKCLVKDVFIFSWWSVQLGWFITTSCWQDPLIIQHYYLGLGTEGIMENVPRSTNESLLGLLEMLAEVWMASLCYCRYKVHKYITFIQWIFEKIPALFCAFIQETHSLIHSLSLYSEIIELRQPMSSASILK